MIDPYFVTIFAVTFLYAFIGLKHIEKDERIVLFWAGKPRSVVGPGFVFVWPLILSSKKLDLRPHSLSLPEVRSGANEEASVVSGQFTCRIIDPLKAATVVNIRDNVKQVLTSTLQEALTNATLQQCLLESYWLERPAMELVNERMKPLGIRVTALTFTGFPAHAKLVSELIGTLDRCLHDPASMIEQITQGTIAAARLF